MPRVILFDDTFCTLLKHRAVAADDTIDGVFVPDDVFKEWQDTLALYRSVEDEMRQYLHEQDAADLASEPVIDPAQDKNDLELDLLDDPDDELDLGDEDVPDADLFRRRRRA